MTTTKAEMLEILQRGCPELVGYGPQTAEAFRKGWAAALDMVYAELQSKGDVPCSRCAGEGFVLDADLWAYVPCKAC